MNRNVPLCAPSFRISVAGLAAAASLLFSTLGRADEVFPVVHNEPITVRVLGGKDGMPRARAHVVLVGGYDGRDLSLGQWRQEAVTDATGRVELSNGLRNLPWLRVEALKGYACAPEAGSAALSVELIRRDGMSAANRCGVVTAESAPGVLTVYVSETNPWKTLSKRAARKAVLRARKQARVEAADAAATTPVAVRATAEGVKVSPAMVRSTAMAAVPAPWTDAEINAATDQLLAEQP